MQEFDNSNVNVLLKQLQLASDGLTGEPIDLAPLKVLMDRSHEDMHLQFAKLRPLPDLYALGNQLVDVYAASSKVSNIYDVNISHHVIHTHLTRCILYILTGIGTPGIRRPREQGRGLARGRDRKDQETDGFNY